MDTKTPPIPQRQHNIENSKSKTPGRPKQVSLPPLSPPPNRRQRLKTPGSSSWARTAPAPATIYRNGCDTHEIEHPYRILHFGATSLMHACQQADRNRVIRLLKEQKETVGYRDRTLRSALHYCMDAGSGGAVASAAPELVNSPDVEGHTPLHLAVIAGDAQLVAVLLANGADVNAKDLEGHSVLHWATVCGEVECVRLVLAAGARPSTPDMRGGSPLHYAAQCCGSAAPTELAVPKKVGLKVLQSLLDYGANFNAKDEDGRQPILWAASAGSVEAILALARAGGSAAAGASDKDGLTALHCAASRGHAGCVEALVNLCGSQPDHVDDNGCSALHYAATLGHADATALLLRLKADPNRQDRKGRTPALCAAAKGQLETLKLLVQHGGSLHARTVRGSGVAHESAASGRVELIKWLGKKRPALLDVATHDGKTPLHVAALHGHLDACKVLLDHGARVNAILRTTKGSQMTAMDAALYHGHRDCAKLIQMHGGTTAKHVRSQKVGAHKELAAKLRIKYGEETSSESDDGGSVRRRCRRRRETRGPDLYYEERWEERRSRRRGSLRRSERTGSRSFSEEEPRVTNIKTARSWGRRARSESARYDDEEWRKRGKSRAKRKSKVRKHNYDETSTDSDSYRDSRSEPEEATEPEYRRGSSSNASGASDDSLEVVIVKKSVEKTSEKVQMSGRKFAKTPRGKKGPVLTSTKSKTRQRSVRKRSNEHPTAVDGNEMKKVGKANSQAIPKGEESLPKVHSSSKSSPDLQPGAGYDSPKNDAAKNFNETDLRYAQYQMETADSTSQEAVERVTVTALVHKAHVSDTPKTTSIDSSSRNGNGETVTKGESSKIEEDQQRQQRENDSRKKTRPRSARPNSSRSRAVSARTRMDHILERADEMQSALVQKAANLKKGIEDMSEHISDSFPIPEPGVEDERENSSSQSEEKISDDIVALDEKTGVGESDKFHSKERHVKSDSESPFPDKSAVDDAEGESTTNDRPRDEEDYASSQNSSVTPGEEQGRENDTKGERDGTDIAAASEIPSTDASNASPGSKKSAKIDSQKPKINKDLRSGRKSARKTLVDDASVSDADDKRGAASASREKTPPRSPTDRSKMEGKSSSEKLKQVSGSREINKKGVKHGSKRADSGKTSSGKSSELDHENVDEETQETIPKPLAGKSSAAVDRYPETEDHQESSEGYLDMGKESLKSELESHFQESQELGTENPEDNSGVAMKSVSLGSSSFRRSRSSSQDSRSRSESRPSTARHREGGRGSASFSKFPTEHGTAAELDSAAESSPPRTAIVAVIESPEWQEDEEDEAIVNEIREAIGDYPDIETDPEDNSVGVMRVLPSTSDDEITLTTVGRSRNSGIDALFQVVSRPHPRGLQGAPSPEREAEKSTERRMRDRNRRDSGGRDSGIEPSPRISKIPKRSSRCYPNTEKQQALQMETVTRDVQISLRRYHLERKIFFQLMELKRLQIRHGRANEQVLVKRQVEAFHKAGTTGPTLGVAKYDQPLTFRHFESFLYEQLRRLQRRPATPDWCTGAKQCTQKTHRCHHATSAYTSLPVYTYRESRNVNESLSQSLSQIPIISVGVNRERAGTFLPNIEGKGRGRMTVELTHGEDKQVIALPAERLDRSKKYYVTFTVRGEAQGRKKKTKNNSQLGMQRNAKSV